MSKKIAGRGNATATDMLMPDVEGWGFPGMGRSATHRAHYFINGESLCGRWGFYFGSHQLDNGPSPDDCAACRKKLDKRHEDQKASQ